MSYDINFKIKVNGLDDYYVTMRNSTNITWNLREMIVKSTGLEWKNEANNGLCKDVIVYIAHGYSELLHFPEKYKKYNAPNGWGDINSCKEFFLQIMRDWNEYCSNWKTADLADVTYFWIE